MKRLFIILLVLCPCFAGGIMQAQLYTTSSSRGVHLSTSKGVIATPSISNFRSTSVYRTTVMQENTSTSYSAPMYVANGAIQTVASSIRGGVLSEEGENNVGYISPMRRAAVIPGVPDTPIGEGWDVALLLALLCVGYVVRRYLTLKQVNDK